MAEQNIETDGNQSGGGSKLAGYLQIALIVAVIALALFFARAPAPVELEPLAAADAAPPLVTVVRPRSGDASPSVDATGSVLAEYVIAVRSSVPGRIAEIAPDFRAGGEIAANEPFVLLDPEPYELELAAASGAELALAEWRLAQTRVSLPFDVIVIGANASVGNLTGPEDQVGDVNSVLGMVYRPGELNLPVQVTQEDFAYLSPVEGRAARVVTAMGEYAATVRYSGAVIAPQTRLRSLYLYFDEGQPSLPLPGTFAEVFIEGPANTDAVMLPAAAIRDGESVWVVRDGQLFFQPVDILRHTESGALAAPFDAGDGVVITVLARAREGMEVRIAQ